MLAEAVAIDSARSQTNLSKQTVLGSDLPMKSTPAPPVDRIERTVNPFVLAFLVLCLAGAVAALWLAPHPTGVMILSWLMVALAGFGALGLLLFAFGRLQFTSRAARFDTTKAIADSSPDGL